MAFELSSHIYFRCEPITLNHLIHLLYGLRKYTLYGINHKSTCIWIGFCRHFKSPHMRLLLLLLLYRGPRENVYSDSIITPLAICIAVLLTVYVCMYVCMHFEVVMGITTFLNVRIFFVFRLTPQFSHHSRWWSNMPYAVRRAADTNHNDVMRTHR